jgi:hypothetical protein
VGAGQRRQRVPGRLAPAQHVTSGTRTSPRCRCLPPNGC